jgi:multidrug efflux pump
LSLLLLLAGVQAYFSLNVRQYPRSDIAVINVKTRYTGASPDLVRGFVTTPLERAIASTDGIDYIESQSAQSLSIITAHLKLNFDTNAALTQAQAKIAQIKNELPPEAESPSIELTTSDSQFALMYISFYSDEIESNQITDSQQSTACRMRTFSGRALLRCGFGSNQTEWPRFKSALQTSPPPSPRTTISPLWEAPKER